MAIDFRIGKGGILTARAGKYQFEIKENGAAYYWVRAKKTTRKGTRTMDTLGHIHFQSIGEAEEFCTELADGRLDFRKIREEIQAADANREQAEIETATERAKVFRDKLDALCLSYSKLLDLERERQAMGDLANNYLAGWERGEGWPKCID